MIYVISKLWTDWMENQPPTPVVEGSEIEQAPV